MVVVAARDRFIQLVAGELIGTGDTVHDTGLVEHGQVPVGGALGKRGACRHQLRGGQGSLGVREGLDELPPTSGIALLDGVQAASDSGVDLL